MARRTDPAGKRKSRPVTIRAAWIAGSCAVAAAIAGPLLASALSGTSPATSVPAAPSKTSTIPQAPKISVRQLSGLLGDGTGSWIVTKPMQDLSPFPAEASESAVEQWVAKNNAIDSDTVKSGAVTNLVVTVQGQSSAQIVLTDIDFVVVHRGSSTIHGGLVNNEGAGPLTFRYVQVDLDSKPPKITGSSRNYFAGPSAPAWQRTPVRFPYYVSGTSTETFNILAYTDSDVTWYAEILWTVDGKNGDTIINNNGKPFETAVASRANTEYQFTDNRWKACPKGDASCANSG